MKWICAILIFTWMIVRLGDGLFGLIDVLITYLILWPIEICMRLFFGDDQR
jgi:hypothetical protein